VRAVIVRASVAAALAAVVLGGILSWDRLGDSRAHLSDFHADRYAAIHERLPVSTFDRWRAQLGEGDRWWLDVPPGPSVGLTNRGAVHRTYALYWFLPALPAPSREEATDVFRRPHAGYEIYCIGPACP
jgi:hypothetical protein